VKRAKTDISGLQNFSGLDELQKKILITFLLLFVYRLGIHIPTPGIDAEALAAFFAQMKGGTLLNVFDMFAGGGLRKLSIFALGIMPYISAEIIIELLTVVVPKLDLLKKEGQEGYKKINQYARYGTILICLIQGFGMAVGLEKMTSPNGMQVVLHPGWLFRINTMITLTTGTVFLMWLGERITEKGISNGISLIIFAGIVTRLPAAIINTLRLIRTGELSLLVAILILVLAVVVVGIIIFFETAQRRIPIHYAKRVVGRKVYGGQSTFLPLKLNTAGVIPPIFASSLLLFPGTITTFVKIPIFNEFNKYFHPTSILYNVIYVALIFGFCFFYTAITFRSDNVADNLKKYGGFVPGIRPGKKTAEYIDKILTRITFWGAIYVSAVCILPKILLAQFNVPFYLGGTSLLIVVGVAIEVMQNIESYLINRNYDGLIKKGKKAFK
jgi:preprotein translocase subunit SecY